MKSPPKNSVVFLNARTCGIYKNGGPRFKTDPATGRRTNEVDDELNEMVDAYISGKKRDGIVSVPLSEVRKSRVIVPTYYDHRYEARIEALLKELKWDETTIGELIDDGTILVRGGHGSPGNDQRSGAIPYIKVSDIRGLRVNTNPTNLVAENVAQRYWRGTSSGLQAFDILTPNRASSNIGEFAILLPGEERVVITKEVFIFRVQREDTVWDPFVLFWSLCLRAVREQWRRIALMQTNREDCGSRHREIRLPVPPSKEAAQAASASFRQYFTRLAKAKTDFLSDVSKHHDRYIASVFSSMPLPDEPESDGEAE
jgi:type I restriction enzyme M protein